MERRPGRPRQLSLDAIVQAVLDDGLATFSMPSIAARLGVAHSGLYRYVHDRNELLVLAIERAALSVQWPEPDLPWRDLLQQISRTVWTICEQFPGYDTAALSPPYWPQRLIETVAPYIGSLQRQGFTIEDASVAVEFAGNLALTTSVARHLRLPAEAEDEDDPLPSARQWHDRMLGIVLDGLEGRRVS